MLPEPVSGGLGKTVGLGGKGLGIDEFSFDGGGDTFDTGIGIGTGWRARLPLGAEALHDGQSRLGQHPQDVGHARKGHHLAGIPQRHWPVAGAACVCDLVRRPSIAQIPMARRLSFNRERF
jgi:hypothetical protein